jgi:hypothetical protein
MSTTPDPSGDYGYDLTHQDLDAAAGHAATSPESHPAAPPPPDRDPAGDYGYDEAHGF